MGSDNNQESGCELCGAHTELSDYKVSHAPSGILSDTIQICPVCFSQLSGAEKMNPGHWRCLNESIWSENPAVKVVAWRLLNRIVNEGWPRDLLDMMYLDEEQLAWASAEDGSAGEEKLHRDSNGNILQNGDNVVLTQTLDVKGSTITAKRGTAVRGIALVVDNPEQIEGRVEGQKIVILTKYVKKTG